MRIPASLRCRWIDHSVGHAFGAFNALQREGIYVQSRRNMLKASMQGIAGLTVPTLLSSHAQSIAAVC